MNNIRFSPAQLANLAKEAAETAQQKGFIKEDYSPAHYLALILSELYEAVQADRKDRHLSPQTASFVADAWYDTKKHDLPDTYFIYMFHKHIQDTAECELADAFIRILSFAHTKGYNFLKYEGDYFVEYPGSITEFVYHTTLGFLNPKLSLQTRLINTLNLITGYCNAFNIPLACIVRLKMEYNRLRTYNVKY